MWWTGLYCTCRGDDMEVATSTTMDRIDTQKLQSITSRISVPSICLWVTIMSALFLSDKRRAMWMNFRVFRDDVTVLRYQLDPTSTSTFTARSPLLSV